jgi:hypothetical protein
LAGFVSSAAGAVGLDVEVEEEEEEQKRVEAIEVLARGARGLEMRGADTSRRPRRAFMS